MPPPRTCVYNLGWTKLGHVCRLWTMLLLEIQTLWANDLCTLNNSALDTFLRRAEWRSLTIDFNSIHSDHMRSKGSRGRRFELLLENMSRARVLRVDCEREELFIFKKNAGQPLPFLEVLELSSVDKFKKLPEAPNLREVNLVGPVTLDAPSLLKAIDKVAGPLPHSRSLRSLELKWSIPLCAEITTLLVEISSLKEFALELEDNRLPDAIDAYPLAHKNGACLPALSGLRVTGYGTAHRSICDLLAQLTAASARTLRRFEVSCTHPALPQSSLALDSLKIAVKAIEADSVYLHFRDVPSGIVAVISLSNFRIRHDPELCPFVTFRINIAEGFDLSVDDLLRTKLMPLLPLDRITHLFLDCIPMPEASIYTPPAFILAFKQLTSVHTLYACDNDRRPAKHFSLPESHPLVGALTGPRCLPVLKALHASYTTCMFRDWWIRLAITLAIRHRTGMPLSSLFITHKWRSNARRPEGAARSHLETFHRLPDENPADSGILLLNFILKTPDDAYNVDGGSEWAKEKVESVARSLFAQVVDTVEVEEASGPKPFWPPNL